MATVLIVAASVAAAGAPASAESPAKETAVTAAQRQFFEQKIRPVLVEHCYECHSAESKTLQGSLRVDTRAGLLRGGDSGAAIEPGRPDASLLIHALRYDGEASPMPPSGKLPAHIIADFERWVATGAADPRVADAPPQTNETGQTIDFAEARQHWSFQRPGRHPLPAVERREWVRQPIDTFLLARLEAAGLQPSAEADRRTLVRRVTYDLTGLPPTPEEVCTFLADSSPDAYARLIERLLASPHYGERWGRHWLDVVRYAEDNTNMGPHNGPYEFAWRYRDWVVRAFNADMPYDEFLIRQLATDLLPETGPEDLAALGMIGLSPQYHKEVQLSRVVIQNRYADDWEDRVDLIGRGLLGLTLACARCHDHKYDPIRAADYYAIAGVFASCRLTTRPIVPQSVVEQSEPARQAAAKLEKEIEALEKAIAARKKANPKNPKQGPTDEEQATLAAKRAEIERLKKTPYFELPLANAVTEETILVEETDGTRVKLAVYPDQPRDLPIFIRGDAGRPGPELIPRRFVEVLCDGEPQPFTQGSGRLELARAIASPENPLTARVIVNRVWMHHFGSGLVATPSNFGSLGQPPSHPELLDDLTVRFMENGWSLKWLHREIVLSAAYRQESGVRGQESGVSENDSSFRTPVRSDESPSGPQPSTLNPQRTDPENRLMWRMNRRRLGAEAVRDTILAVSGRLDASVGGPSGDVDSADFVRRTIYGKVSRHKLSDTLATFDFPDPTIHCEQRTRTTTPLQQLFVLNSPFVRQSAEALAGRVRTSPHQSLDDRVDWLHELLFTRPAGAEDVQIARDFLGEDAAAEMWTRYVHALLASNELQSVD